MIQQLRLDVEDLAETVDEQDITNKKLDKNLKTLKQKLHENENLLKSKDEILEALNKQLQTKTTEMIRFQDSRSRLPTSLPTLDKTTQTEIVNQLTEKTLGPVDFVVSKSNASVKNRQTSSQLFQHRSHESLDRFINNTTTSFESLPSNSQSISGRRVPRKGSQSTYRQRQYKTSLQKR